MLLTDKTKHMKRYNVLDYNENLVASNLSLREAIAFINGRIGFLLEERLTDED